MFLQGYQQIFHYSSVECLRFFFSDICAACVVAAGVRQVRDHFIACGTPMRLWAKSNLGSLAELLSRTVILNSKSCTRSVSPVDKGARLLVTVSCGSEIRNFTPPTMQTRR